MKYSDEGEVKEVELSDLGPHRLLEGIEASF